MGYIENRFKTHIVEIHLSYHLFSLDQAIISIRDMNSALNFLLGLLSVRLVELLDAAVPAFTLCFVDKAGQLLMHKRCKIKLPLHKSRRNLVASSFMNKPPSLTNV